MLLPTLIISTVLAVFLLLGAYTAVYYILHHDYEQYPVKLIILASIIDMILIYFILDYFQQYLQIL